MAANQPKKPKKNTDEDIAIHPGLNELKTPTSAYDASISDDIWINSTSNRAEQLFNDDYYAQESAKQASIVDDNDLDVRDIVPEGIQPVANEPRTQEKEKDINNSILEQLNIIGSTSSLKSEPVKKTTPSAKSEPVKKTTTSQTNQSTIKINTSNQEVGNTVDSEDKNTARSRKVAASNPNDENDKELEDDLEDDVVQNLDTSIDQALLAQLSKIGANNNSNENPANIRRKYAERARKEVEGGRISPVDATNSLAQEQLDNVEIQRRAQSELSNNTSNATTIQTSPNSTTRSNNPVNSGSNASPTNASSQPNATTTTNVIRPTASSNQNNGNANRSINPNNSNSQTNNSNATTPNQNSNNNNQAIQQPVNSSNAQQPTNIANNGYSYVPAPAGQALKNNTVGLLSNAMGLLRNTTGVVLATTNYAGKFGTTVIRKVSNLTSSSASTSTQPSNATTTNQSNSVGSPITNISRPPSNSSRSTQASNASSSPSNPVNSSSSNTSTTTSNPTNGARASSIDSASSSPSNLVNSSSSNTSTTTSNPTNGARASSINNASGRTIPSTAAYTVANNAKPPAVNVNSAIMQHLNSHKLPSTPPPEQRKGLFKRIKDDSPLHELSTLEKSSLNKIFNDNDRITRNMNSLENDPNLSDKQRSKKQNTLNKNFDKYLDNSEVAKELISKNKPKDGSEPHLEASKLLDKLNNSVDKKMQRADKKGLLYKDTKEDLQDRMRKIAESTKNMLENLKKVLDSVASVATCKRKPGG